MKTTRAKAAAPDPWSVGAIMTPQPVTIGQKESLATAHRLMRSHGVRHLPVLEHGDLVGILSQRDLLFLETIRGVDTDADTVEDAMTTDTYSVSPETPIATVAKLLPLLVIAIGGALFVHADNLRIVSMPAAADVARTSLLLIFAFAGIECALVPSGEVRDTARTVPRAIALAMIGITVLYIALQLVALLTGGTPDDVRQHPNSHTGKALRDYDSALGVGIPLVQEAKVKLSLLLDQMLATNNCVGQAHEL